MSLRKMSAHLAHSLRFQRLACAALIGLLLTDRACGAEEPADPYDVLYDVIMTRYGPDGKAHGAHESSDRQTYEVGSPVKISRAIAKMKRADKTWKRLQELWPETSRPNDSRR